MKKVLVSQIEDGNRIEENVLTSTGKTLFYKGTILKQREIEILKAFQIKEVFIDSNKKQGETKKAEKPQPKEPEVQTVTVSSFHKEYLRMLELIKKTFRNADSYTHIPLLDIRNQLNALIHHLDEYNILTFKPLTMNISDYLYHKSIKVSLTAYSLAAWCSLPSRDLIPIAMGGLLHDIGKMKVDEALLNKPSKLTTEEFIQVKQHSLLGYNILKNVAGLNEGVKLAVLQHHEKEDGSGYPLAVKREKIHIYAKFVSIAEIFHAMTSDRYHQKAKSPFIALESLFDESFGKLDPILVQNFINKTTQFSKGTIVKLSDESIGEIIFIDRAHPTRPLITVNGKIMNLATDHSLFIQEIIKRG